jgi:hypothetical protein
VCTIRETIDIEATRGVLKLVYVPEQTQKLLGMTKLAGFFDLCGSMEEAIWRVRV